MKSSLPSAILLVACAAGCKRPPPAPEGLDESARFMVREFYADDDVVGAGLTGFLNWYDQGGAELQDKSATLDDVGAFTLGDLTWDDIEHLPLLGDRDPSAAAGVVSVASIGCDWTETEALYARADQMAVFEGDYDAYDRDYLSDRAAFEAATASGEFPPVDDAVQAFTDDLGELEADFLLTRNAVTQSTAGITIATDLILHMRHGVYNVQGQDTEVSMVFAFTPERAVGEAGNNALNQSYSIVINVARGQGSTLRMFAIWTELDTIFFGADSAAIASAAVNKSQDAAERLSAICAGDIDLPPEGG